MTSLLTGSPSFFLRLIGPVANLIFALFGKTPVECGAFMWYGLLKAPQGGSMRMGENGENIGRKNYNGRPEARQKLWEHSVKATNIN
jgi:hypothetical protein